MIDLEKIFSDVSLNWIDNNHNDILNSEIYREFLQLFPKLKDIFQNGLNTDKSEFERTLRHTFRLLIVYYQSKNDKFEHKTLNNYSIEEIKKRIERIDQVNSNFLPLILILHDIGRPFNKKLHTYQSAKIIKDLNLLDDYKLSKKEKMLVIKVIEYHLLIGTIFTGESTYFAVKSLLNDKEFVKFLNDREFIENFVFLSSTFTILDPFGYFYAEIFDHYIEKYSEIQQKIFEFLSNWPNIKLIQEGLKNECFKELDWRLACSLRIFQLIGTNPKFTYDFFIDKIKDSVQRFLNNEMDEKDWIKFKQNYLSETYKAQLKYALPFLIILAYGEFKRAFQPKPVNTDLIHFWICLNQKIKEENAKTKFKDQIWNVIFENLPHWSELKESLSQILNKDLINSVIQNAKVQFDIERKENWLLINFKFES